MKRLPFRRRWLGVKHGVARGVLVYGSPGFDTSGSLQDLLSQCEGLRQWSRDHGLVLDDEPATLAALDDRLDSWNLDPSHHGQVDLANESGKYLGTVIVKHVAGSQWTVWPNGHPVVRLSNGKELDVTRLCNDRLTHSGRRLDALYSEARTP